MIEDEGNEPSTFACEYREIAAIMTECGHAMNYMTARNHFLKTMKKFVVALARHAKVKLTDDQVIEVAHDHDFQETIAEMLARHPNI